MSEIELAAAIRPHVLASSTSGVIKSAVKQIAISSDTRSAAASSSVSGPTSSLGSVLGSKPESAFDRSPGPNLAAHPDASTIWVSRIGLSSMRFSS